ncbi:DUF4965 domain-containing protein [Candidatus Sumerlaeota bacterium]|nr:DUF4965 domain-containing protein [Candidatus Sumerlaeota bacterium]
MREKALPLMGIVPSLLLLVPGLFAIEKQKQPFRPPAVPLVTCDPYFSVWSPADALYESPTIHWTGKPHRLTCMARIDGKVYRLMGEEPSRILPLPQTNLEILPTRSIYSFADEMVGINLSFLSPCFPYDLDIYSRPVTYLIWEIRSLDKKKHKVSLYFDASSELAVDSPEQPVTWSFMDNPLLNIMKIGIDKQLILGKSGDDMRIDWGHLYLALPKSDQNSLSINDRQKSQDCFASGIAFPIKEDERKPRAPKDNHPALASVMECGEVSEESCQRFLILAYDDIFSIRFFSQKIRSYWRLKHEDALSLLKQSYMDYENIVQDCMKFDRELMEDLEKAGGREYALIAALAYRQGVAGNKLAADSNGQPLLFPKECFSNGCIGTVDVIYPMNPQFLLFHPGLAKASLAPLLVYAASSSWKHPFAPHDLGTYPFATGQAYGGGEETEENQMPIEESGNMLILLDAIAQIEGNTNFADNYWQIITRWAQYLKEKGLDPENQLCTDDFTGHLAHNVNLSAKAIIALAAYADLCKRSGRMEQADLFRKTAEDFASQWARMADDGDHYRLAFDKPGTWSLKYNLVWDRILNFKLFPNTILEKELAWYYKMQNAFGVPLDNRSSNAKMDWLVWAACLTENRDDFRSLISPLYKALNATPQRVPMTDWYDTTNAERIGFQARPVVGGVFIPLLQDRKIREKYSSRAKPIPNNWAPLPPPLRFYSIMPHAREEQLGWRYTTTKPAEDWYKAGFDDSGWETGKAGFGSKDTPGGIIGTTWDTSDIWLRREFNLAELPVSEIILNAHHDENAQIYINGILAVDLYGFTTNYENYYPYPEGKEALKKGENVIAIHCSQAIGGQYIDVGLKGVKAE